MPEGIIKRKDGTYEKMVKIPDMKGSQKRISVYGRDPSQVTTRVQEIINTRSYDYGQTENK
jgi:hypothetical protein